MARLIIKVGYKTFLAPAGNLDNTINFLSGLIPVKEVSRYGEPDRYEHDPDNQIEFKIVGDDVDKVDENFWREKCKGVESDLSKKDSEYWKKYNEASEANKKLAEAEAKLKTMEETLQAIHKDVPAPEGTQWGLATDSKQVSIDGEDGN